MGKRGEGWVALQMLVLVLTFISPKIEAFAFPLWLRIIGAALVLLGGSVGILGILSLGNNLSPFPKPKQGGHLVSTGVYGLVRHPIYSGLIVGSLGWALVADSMLGIGLACLLFVVLDLKSRREERWLSEAYADYPTYQKRVRKLIPLLY